MNSDTLICIGIPVFPIGIFVYRLYENEVLPSFQFGPQLQSSKHAKLFITLLVERNGAM